MCEWAVLNSNKGIHNWLWAKQHHCPMLYVQQALINPCCCTWLPLSSRKVTAWAPTQCIELTLTSYWQLFCFIWLVFKSKIKYLLWEDRKCFLFLSNAMDGERGQRKCSELPQLYSFCLLNCYHNHFRVLSFWSFCLSVLCMHDQGGGMHSKPNLHVPQQGENERERKSKERERLSAKNT